MREGILLVSLDFELMWGFYDLPKRKEVVEAVLGARKAIPKLLTLFTRYEIHATWATVGFLLFETKKDLLAAIPEKRPQYHERRLDPYTYLNEVVGEGEKRDPLHYGLSLVEQIVGVPGQEIGTHTFSHYLCLEEGANPSTFEADLEAAIAAGKRLGLKTNSLVFPRNQFHPSYLSQLQKAGILVYRGNARSWIYQPAPSAHYNHPVKKLLRLIDVYVNLTGSNTYPLPLDVKEGPLNMPRSRFLRPYIKSLAHLESLRLSRIKGEMLKAARNGHVYHLCLHPHNFGTNVTENFRFLEEILKYHRLLRQNYGMQSINMGEAWKKVSEFSN